MSGSPIRHDRSQSRGRDVSFGRGGLGNIRPASVTRNAESPISESKEHSVPRGRGIVREVPGEDGSEEFHDHVDHHDGLLHSTGRGGLANITSLRSPSVESPRPHDRVAPESDVGIVSSGRGGAGNIRSRSRSKARNVETHPHPAPNVLSTGRGGVGNIHSRSQSLARTDEGKPHSPAPHKRNVLTDGHGSDGTAVGDNEPHKHGILHKVTHPGEHKG